MSNQEKVINGLKLLANWPDGLIITDKEKWIKPCCEMAIALLKEQEPVSIVRSNSYEEYWDREAICPDCGTHWMSYDENEKRITKYCPGCGRKVK